MWKGSKEQSGIFYPANSDGEPTKSLWCKRDGPARQELVVQQGKMGGTRNSNDIYSVTSVSGKRPKDVHLTKFKSKERAQRRQYLS